MLKVNYKDFRMTLRTKLWKLSRVFAVNFKQISNLFLSFLLLTSNRKIFHVATAYFLVVKM